MPIGRRFRNERAASRHRMEIGSKSDPYCFRACSQAHSKFDAVPDIPNYSLQMTAVPFRTAFDHRVEGKGCGFPTAMTFSGDTGS